MPKTVDPVPDVNVDVMKESSGSNYIIYIILFLCVIIIGSFFMYKIYKKIQTLNDSVINITNKGDTLDSNSKEHNRQIDILAENLRRVESNVTNTIKKIEEAPKHVEIPIEHRILEDITEE